MKSQSYLTRTLIRVSDVKLRREDKARRIHSLRESFDQYLQERSFSDRTVAGESTPIGPAELAAPALVPQVDSSFLDRLLEMSGESNDLRFRQDMTERILRVGMEESSLEQDREYYQKMVRKISGLRKRNADNELIG